MPRLQDTLLLRLTGKGPTLQQAIEDLDALPQSHRLRKLALEIIALFHLDKRRRRNDPEEELYMSITNPTYHQFIQEQRRLMQEQQHLAWLAGKTEGIQQGKAEGIQQGKAEGKDEGKTEGKSEGLRAALVRFLCKRFGGEAATWGAALEQVGRVEALEALSEALYDATSREEAEAALERAKG